MLNYLDDEEPTVCTKPQTGLTHLEQMRRSSSPHTSPHPQSRYTAAEDERRYAAGHESSPPVSQASYSPPQWMIKDSGEIAKEEMRQEMEYLSRRQDALMLEMARMEMDHADHRPRPRYGEELPYHSRPSSTRPVPAPRQGGSEVRAANPTYSSPTNEETQRYPCTLRQFWLRNGTTGAVKR